MAGGNQSLAPIEALSRQTLDAAQKARSLTKATEHWHQEAKDQLATKEDLHGQTWRFVSFLGLMTAILVGRFTF